MASVKPVKILDFTVAEAADDNKEAVWEDIKRLMKLIDSEIEESTLSIQVRMLCCTGYYFNSVIITYHPPRHLFNQFYGLIMICT